jgi:hypothetical protein
MLAPRAEPWCLRHRRFVLLFGMSAPARANVWRRPPPLHEGIHRLAHSRPLDLSERHDRYSTLCKFTVWALRPTLRHFLIASKIAARLSIIGT